MKNYKIKKTKAKCPCCGAKGFEFEKPILIDEYQHFQDNSGVKDEMVGREYIKGAWIGSCIHKTGKKVRALTAWEEYDCNCNLDYNC